MELFVAPTLNIVQIQQLQCVVQTEQPLVEPNAVVVDNFVQIQQLQCVVPQVKSVVEVFVAVTLNIVQTQQLHYVVQTE